MCESYIKGESDSKTTTNKRKHESDKTSITSKRKRETNSMTV